MAEPVRGPIRAVPVAVRVPTARVLMLPATHASTPYEKGQDREAHGPVDEEAQDHQRNPGGLPEVVQSCRNTTHGISPREC